jgi:hypothetical protein
MPHPEPPCEKCLSWLDAILPFLRTPPTAANAAPADGSVRPTTGGISAATLQALATITGYDKVGDEF